MECRVQPLTGEAFAPYGSYVNPGEGHGGEGVTFRADRQLQLLGVPMASLCSIRMTYRPLVAGVGEYHNDCEEVFGGFNCEVVFHVGLLDGNGNPDPDSMRVFRLPAGWYARVKRRVLHHAGFVTAEGDVAGGIVLLSPSAYTVDCHLLEYETPIQIVL